MNCPAHVQIFNQRLHSYRDLPLRMAEFGSCHRNEPSGALHGLMRVRAFTQDDAHIFCTPEQISQETIGVCDLLKTIYRDFGFADFFVRFADRPPVRAGSDEIWDRAEQALKEATAAAGLDTQLNPGEGAFYGPKLEFILRDAIGREWQCGTHQVDFVLPERLNASYIGEDGQKHRPVMLHRAILGSMERFIGILIEQHAGNLPLWLAPVQAVVATITNDSDDYAREVGAALAAAGIRHELDLRSDKIGYKVREHSLAKVPLILAVGRREAEQRTVSVRRLGSERQETLALDASGGVNSWRGAPARSRLKVLQVAVWPRPLAVAGASPFVQHEEGITAGMAGSREDHRINENIENNEVRLIDENGEMVGVVPLSTALERAQAAGFDLVEVSPNADPPVCKILDYGKFKYEAQKKANAARKKQRVIDVKEIKMRPNIDSNDYNIKMRKIHEFLSEGDKVKVTLRFRGRELAHQDLAMSLLERVRDELGDTAKVEQFPKMEGRQMVMIMAPPK